MRSAVSRFLTRRAVDSFLSRFFLQVRHVVVANEWAELEGRWTFLMKIVLVQWMQRMNRFLGIGVLFSLRSWSLRSRFSFSMIQGRSVPRNGECNVCLYLCCHFPDRFLGVRCISSLHFVTARAPVSDTLRLNQHVVWTDLLNSDLSSTCERKTAVASPGYSHSSLIYRSTASSSSCGMRWSLL